MSSYGILSDLLSLERLRSSNTTTQQQVAEPDLASLPSLPSTDDDDTELEEIISRDQWGDAIASPEETYNKYQGTVEYFIPDRQGTLNLCHRPHTTRTEVLFTLEHFYCLRKHLTTNLNLLTEFGEVNLSSPPSFQTRRSASLTALELAQHSFAIHHIGISETLIDADNLGTLAFGLPAYDDYRLARNYFAHASPTPKVDKNGGDLSWAMQGKKDLYEALLRHVKANVDILEHQLLDDGLWTEPPPPRAYERVEDQLPVWEHSTTYEPQSQDDDFGAEGAEDSFEQHAPTEQRGLLTRFGVFCCRSTRIAGWAKSVGDWLFTVGGGYDSELDLDAASAAEEERAGVVGLDDW